MKPTKFDPKIGYGFCQCGCGQKTKIAQLSYPGQVKGQPNRFLVGHNRPVPPEHTYKFDPKIGYGFCHCGCGQKTELAKMTDTKRGFVGGQPNRYVRNHQSCHIEHFSTLPIATGIERNLHLAYLNGVIHGDGWLDKASLGLRVADKDFAEAFAVAASAVSGRPIVPQLSLDYRRQFRSVCNWEYWSSRSGNRNGAFNCVREFIPVTESELGAWLRGMFDSEGNATCRKLKAGPGSYQRAIEFFNCNTTTIEKVVKYLGHLGITSRSKPMKTDRDKGHLGTKQVYRVTLYSSIENFSLFRDLVGSNIKRKRDSIELMISTYNPDIRAHCRAIQLKGAATRTRRMLEVNLPRIVQAIADRMATGRPVTIEACAKHIHGYYGVFGRHFTQSQLKEKAKELLCKKFKSA